MNFQFARGTTPLLISIPHAGTRLPPEWAGRWTPQAEQQADTDWHVDRLYDFANALGVGVLTATHSRYVVDLNRPPDDRPLYEGAGTGLVPLTTFSGEPLYRAGQVPDAAEVSRRVEDWWQPYHRQLGAALEDIRQHHGYAIVLDGHSIRSQVPRLFDGRLPDLNLGTNNGISCSPGLAEKAWSILSAAHGFTSVRDGRFRGGFITRHYGQPAAGVHALQLEIAQACYMDEENPTRFDGQRARALITVLRRVVDGLLEYQP